MTWTTTFSGTSEECEDLLQAVARSCMCGFNIFGVRIHECAAHRAMLGDQKFVNGLVCYRRLRARLLAEEGLTA